MDKNISGVASASIDFAGTWSNQLQVDESSIKCESNLVIEKGELNNFSPLNSLSKFVELSELQKIKFSTLNSSIYIRDKKINISKTSINNSVLNINFWGSQSFSYDIDYHIQLLIDDYLRKKRKNNDNEFGPVENDPSNRRSAFILMTGNLDNPIIKYDKSGLKQKVKEDIKIEKQTLKHLLKEEFGWFKKDSIKTHSIRKSNQNFELEKEKSKVPNKNPETDEDDF
jgi:hypothetical protein